MHKETERENSTGTAGTPRNTSEQNAEGTDRGTARSDHASHPTAIAPESVERSVADEIEWAGKQGPDAASPPTAAMKSADSEPKQRARQNHSDSEELAEGSDLEPDEAADVMETRQEAERIKDARDDTQHEDLISLDVPD